MMLPQIAARQFARRIRRCRLWGRSFIPSFEGMLRPAWQAFNPGWVKFFLFALLAFHFRPNLHPMRFTQEETPEYKRHRRNCDWVVQASVNISIARA
jgi:hypothetical protein